MKFRISPTLRLSFGLVSLTISLILMAKFVGLVPDQNAAALSARQKLCEALAVQLSSAAGGNDIRLIRDTLQSVVARSEDMLSAALRDRRGNIIASAGDHRTHWVPKANDRSTPTHVQVPIFHQSRRWGTVEISFAPLTAGTSAWGAARNSLIGLIGFIALAGFIGYFVFLRRALRELDPAGVIPRAGQCGFHEANRAILGTLDRQKVLGTAVA
jgi:hypothetical protein